MEVTFVDLDSNGRITGGGHKVEFDWGYSVLGGPVISPPEIQYSYLEIPGRDGSLNLTEALDGYAHYKDRTYLLRLLLPQSNFEEKLAFLMNALHGKSRAVSSDADPDYHYIGLWSITEVDWENGIVTVMGTVEPYKRKGAEREVKLETSNRTEKTISFTVYGGTVARIRTTSMVIGSPVKVDGDEFTITKIPKNKNFDFYGLILRPGRHTLTAQYNCYLYLEEAVL